MVDEIILFVLEHLLEIGITAAVTAIVLMLVIIKLIKEEIADRE